MSRGLIIRSRYWLFLLGGLIYPGCSEPDSEITDRLVVEEVYSNDPGTVPVLDSTLVRPVLYRQVPDLRGLSVRERKEKFISIILPSILITEYRREKVRNKVNQLLDKAVKKALTSNDSVSLVVYFDMFKTQDTLELRKRLLTPPRSLALAQAAVESGWGTSRFFFAGNNVYGVWSYNVSEPRLRALQSRGKQPIFVRKYDDITASVRDYFRLLSTGRSYARFREILYQDPDPYRLAESLVNYSELRNEYVNRLKLVMRANDLTRYDAYQIDPNYIVK